MYAFPYKPEGVKKQNSYIDLFLLRNVKKKSKVK